MGGNHGLVERERGGVLEGVGPVQLYKTNQPRLPGGARSKLRVRGDAKVALMWGTLDPGWPGALWVPEF